MPAHVEKDAPQTVLATGQLTWLGTRIVASYVLHPTWNNWSSWTSKFVHLDWLTSGHSIVVFMCLQPYLLIVVHCVILRNWIYCQQQQLKKNFAHLVGYPVLTTSIESDEQDPNNTDCHYDHRSTINVWNELAPDEQYCEEDYQWLMMKQQHRPLTNQ